MLILQTLNFLVMNAKRCFFCLTLLFCGIFAVKGQTSGQAVTFWDADDRTFFNLLELESPGMEMVRKAIETGDYEKAASAYLSYRRNDSPARWKAMSSTDSLSAAMLAYADSIYAHFIRDDVNPRPYTSEAVYMGEDFDWLQNPRSSGDPSYSDEWTWAVVSRLKFLEPLISAYQTTSDEKYARKALWFLEDFLQKNPLSAYSGSKSTPKTWRTLEVAIRATSIANTYFALRDSPAFQPKNQLVISALAYHHATRLKEVLENHPERTGNWVTTECYGLYVLGALFPEFKDAESWRSVAINRYVKEIERVVPPDGLQAELSISYHYGVIATYHSVYDVAKLNDLPLPDGFVNKLMDMYRAPILMMDQTGDFVRTNDSNNRNIRRLSRRGIELERDRLLVWAISRGKAGTGPPTSTALEYAGFYAMRSGWNRDDLFLFFRGGPQGIGHAEQDMLQVVLKAWGKTLLFDPGKYTYDQSEWRRFSINTPSHNTIIVDGKWQYREKSVAGEFLPTGNPWITSALFDYVSATYDAGYVTNTYDPTKQYRPERWENDRDTSVAHTRSVIYLKPYYTLVFDELTGIGHHRYDAHFHIDAPSATMEKENQSVFSQRADSVQVALYPLDFTNLKTEIVQGQKDPLLGWMPVEQRPIPTVRYRKEQETPAYFATFLYPYNKEKPSFDARNIEVKDENIWAQYVKTSEEEAEIFLSKGRVERQLSFTSNLAGTVETKASGLMIRKPVNGKEGVVFVGGWGISSYKDQQTEITLSEPASINLINRLGFIEITNVGEKPVEVTFVHPFKKTVRVEPGTWMAVSRKGQREAKEPRLFTSFTQRIIK